MRDLLTRAVIDGALFAAIIWILARVLPRIGPATRTALWWIVTAKFVIGLAWITPLQLPLLPAASTPAPVSGSTAAGFSTVVPLPSSAGDSAGVDWTLVLVVLWIAGAGLSLALAARRWVERCRAARDSGPVDATIERTAAEIARLLGLRHVPRIRTSPATNSPFTTGIRRPAVLLPVRFSKMTPEEQRMTLCHELAHIRRGDLWLGIVPAVAERVFFFHPLARLAAREYVFWREVACDAAVLAALGSAPQAYGRLLLGLGVAARPAALAPAGAAWSFGTLKRRIVMLQRPSAPSLLVRAAAIAALAVAAAGLVPFRLVARTPAMVAAVEPPSPSQPALVEPHLRAGGLLGLLAGVPQSRAESSRGREISFVFMSGDNTTSSGTRQDNERARRLRSGREDMLWFRRDGDEYVVRDPAVLGELRSIWQPVSEVGNAQSAVGARQSAVGARQSEIGVRQSRIGVEQSALGARQSEIGVRQAALGVRQQRNLSAGERTEIERQLRALDDDMRVLDRQMAELEKKMRQLDEPMNDLNDDMSVLGREMDALGRKMDEAQRKAQEEMRALIERAIASGAAALVR